MPSILSRYATPAITGLFLVSLVSGVALFLHVGQGTFREMHELLSMVLVVPFVLHIWRNWRPMTGYLRHAPMAIALGVSLVLALGFALSGGEEGGREGPPQFAVAAALLDDTPAVVAPAFGATPVKMEARLAAAGFPAVGPDATLAEIASAAGQPGTAILGALLPAS